ncbi:MAG: DNA-3-methyladenine glycosylase 2 family protein [Proteobacteria bacterium]|nr:DNA-3-methyladenine glycosylase 2 family protein [Pseudomonadota bacterium]
MKTRKRLEAGLEELAALDPRMGELWAHTGSPGPRARPPGFTTLLRVIVGQQLSTHAAAAIWKRMEVAGITKDPAAFIIQDDEALLAHGLSRQKIVYARGLAEAIVSGGLDLNGLRKQDDDTAIDALVALKGIGRWSAEVYLLFALGRPDIMPADDLALVASAGKHLGDGTRWTPGQLRKEAEQKWRPWRSAAARLLWHAYRIDAI